MYFSFEIPCLALVIIGIVIDGVRHYQGYTNSSWCYIYIYSGHTCAIIVVHAKYVMRQSKVITIEKK